MNGVTFHCMYYLDNPILELLGEFHLVAQKADLSGTGKFGVTTLILKLLNSSFENVN